MAGVIPQGSGFSVLESDEVNEMLTLCHGGPHLEVVVNKNNMQFYAAADQLILGMHVLGKKSCIAQTSAKACHSVSELMVLWHK